MNRRPYTEAMDAEHLDPRKAEETLGLMLKKDRAIRQKAAQKRASSPWLRRLPALAAAAACLVAVWIGFHPAAPAARYTTFQISSLPALPMSQPADPQDAVSAALAARARDLFAGCAVTEDSLTAHLAQLTLVKDGVRLSAAVSDVEPPLYTYLAAGAASADAVSYGLDTDTPARFAVCRRQDLYLVLSSDTLDEPAFTAAVRSVLGQ